MSDYKEKVAAIFLKKKAAVEASALNSKSPPPNNNNNNYSNNNYSNSNNNQMNKHNFHKKKSPSPFKGTPMTQQQGNKSPNSYQNKFNSNNNNQYSSSHNNNNNNHHNNNHHHHHQSAIHKTKHHPSQHIPQQQSQYNNNISTYPKIQKKKSPSPISQNNSNSNFKQQEQQNINNNSSNNISPEKQRFLQQNNNNNNSQKISKSKSPEIKLENLTLLKDFSVTSSGSQNKEGSNNLSNSIVNKKKTQKKGNPKIFLLTPEQNQIINQILPLGYKMIPLNSNINDESNQLNNEIRALSQDPIFKPKSSSLLQLGQKGQIHGQIVSGLSGSDLQLQSQDSFQAPRSQTSRLTKKMSIEGKFQEDGKGNKKQRSEQLEQCAHLIFKMKKHKHGELFSNFDSFHQSTIHLYEPIDLVIIDQKLKKGEYNSHTDFEQDVNHMLQIAIDSNPVDSDLYIKSHEMKFYFQKGLRPFQQNPLEQELQKFQKKLDKITRDLKEYSTSTYKFYHRENKKAKLLNIDKPMSFDQRKQLQEDINKLPMGYKRGIWEILLDDSLDNPGQKSPATFNLNQLSNRKLRELEKYLNMKQDYIRAAKQKTHKKLIQKEQQKLKEIQDKKFDEIEQKEEEERKKKEEEEEQKQTQESDLKNSSETENNNNNSKKESENDKIQNQKKQENAPEEEGEIFEDGEINDTKKQKQSPKNSEKKEEGKNNENTDIKAQTEKKEDTNINGEQLLKESEKIEKKNILQEEQQQQKKERQYDFSSINIQEPDDGFTTDSSAITENDDSEGTY